jgi:hypothetical protein
MTDLVAAARFERDLRADKYPALVASRRLGADEALVDFQAWAAIAHWLEHDAWPAWTGAGGVDERTVVDWALAEDCAAKALAKVLDTAAAAAADKADALNARASHLTAIHRRVQLRRQSIDSLNRQLRAQRQQEHAA